MIKKYYRRKVRSTGDNHYRAVMADSPVEEALKAGPRGDGKWPGFDHVYTAISLAADRMGRSSSHLSDQHIDTMADLGSGQEERMKARLMWLREYGWIV